MLPKLAQSGLSQRNRSPNQEKGLTTKDQSQAAEEDYEKGMKQLKACEQKYQEEATLNKKLKSLYTVLKDNLDKNSTANDEEEELSNLLREKKKYEAQYQHQCQLLNSLISDNSNLKDQVNTERSKRAIYFNIYKGLEHEIQLWQRKYKNQLVETLKVEGVMAKIKERFHKAHKRLKKEIQNINEDIKNCSNQESNIDKEEPSEERGDQVIRLSKNKKTFKDLKFMDRRESKIVMNTENIQPVKNQISQEEQEYQLQQRKVFAQVSLQRIKGIFKLDNIKQIEEYWSDIDEQTEQIYSQILEEQKKDKQLTEDIEDVRDQICKLTIISSQRKMTVKESLDKIQKIQQKKQEVKNLEKRVAEAIGINVSGLENDMILHHCLRVKQQKTDKKEGKRNLEKVLQQSKKNKVECSVLLSPKEMHRRLVESQAFSKEAGIYNN